jgi:hypothetical protein
MVVTVTASQSSFSVFSRHFKKASCQGKQIDEGELLKAKVHRTASGWCMLLCAEVYNGAFPADS